MPGTLQASHPYPPVPGTLNSAGAATAAYGISPSVAVVMQLTHAEMSMCDIGHTECVTDMQEGSPPEELYSKARWDC